MRWILVSILVISMLYLLGATCGPQVVGLWQDDAVYLATGKSLAQGSGYRHIQTPGEPYQTKYPIFFPAVLAAGFLLQPTYPENLALLLTPGALSGAAFVVLSAIYLRKVLGASRLWVAGVAILTGLSPEIISLLRYTMSDLPYAVLSIAGLLALDYKVEQAKTARQRMIWLIASGLLIAAAVLTRYFGLTLVAGAVGTLLLRRRWRDAGILLSVIVVATAPWWCWYAWASGANGALQTSSGGSYDLNYGMWLPSGAGQFARVVWQNIFRLLFGAGFLQLNLPKQWVLSSLHRWSAAAAMFHATCYAAGAMILIGFLTSVRRRLRTMHLYAMAYAIVMLAWPFDPYRFLICWTPFLLYFLLTGVSVTVGLATHLFATLRGRTWFAYIPAGLICAGLLVSYLHEDSLILTSRTKRYYSMWSFSDLSDYEELTRWLGSNTKRGQVLSCNRTADLFLATGRQMRDSWPSVDPYAFFYGPGRRWRSFYALSDPSERDWLGGRMIPHIEKMVREHLADYYIHRADDPHEAPLRRLVSDHREWFTAVHTTKNGTYQVFRVTAGDATPRGGAVTGPNDLEKAEQER